MEGSQQVIALERAALDRRIRTDPDGYLELHVEDASYFDPFCESGVHGLDALEARTGPIRDVKLPFAEPRYEMINPVVNFVGPAAVLTFNLVNYGKPEGTNAEVVLAVRCLSCPAFGRTFRGGAWRAE